VGDTGFGIVPPAGGELSGEKLVSWWMGGEGMLDVEGEGGWVVR
jgi:hypothetical protein